ncbi:MAG: mepM [Cyanobacteria bacterium RYN_339]|nr:mepM [Cyanobacteria bacterium RYN_339]
MTRLAGKLLALAALAGALAVTRTALALEPGPQVLEDAEHAEFPGGNLRVRAERQGDEVRLDVTNGYRMPVTTDFAFATTNLKSAHAPHTLTIPAGGHRRVATFRLVNKDRPINYSYVMNWMFGDPGAAPADTVYDLPYAPGEGFRVLQGYFGAFSHHDVAAIDWAMPEGTPIRAAREGVVTAYNDTAVGSGLDPEYMALEKANWVIVEHDDHTLGCYFHLMPHGIKVSTNTRVLRGQLLGFSGNTGFSSRPHLHFEVRTPIDGTRYRTYPVRFRLRSGDDIPLAGGLYTAP